jgi:hypothetical protein
VSISSLFSSPIRILLRSGSFKFALILEINDKGQSALKARVFAQRAGRVV